MAVVNDASARDRLSRRAVVVAGGDELEPGLLKAVCEGAWVVCADGGYSNALRAGVMPDLLIGDLDSVEPGCLEDARQRGVRIEAYAPGKDQTDTELAVGRCLREGFSDICVACVSGWRADHTFASLCLIAGAQEARKETSVWGLGRGFAALCACPERDVRVAGAVGDTVSLLPVGGDASGVTTRGLNWELDRDDLKWARCRGVSNVMVSEHASVSVAEGLVLVLRYDRGTASRGCERNAR